MSNLSKTVIAALAAIVLTLSVVLVVLMVSGDGNGTAASGTAQESQTTESVLTDSDVVNLMYNEAPETRGIDEATAVEFFHLICEAYDVGMTFEDIAIVLLESGLSAKVGGTLMGLAVGYVCPQHSTLNHSS